MASHPKYRFEQVDLRDKPAVVRVVRDHAITHVLHLAAESHVDRSIATPGDFIQTNVLGTFHLLEACRAAWSDFSFPFPPRFVHVSTDEVFGSLGPTVCFSETSPYAASKAASDLLVRSYHQTYGGWTPSPRTDRTPTARVSSRRHSSPTASEPTTNGPTSVSWNTSTTSWMNSPRNSAATPAA